jgi:endonuclease III
MHPIVKNILDKYTWELPPPVVSQVMNRNLKTMAKIAGFDKPVYKTITKGGKRIEKKYKTFELVSTHTARRSLATNLHLAGVAPKSAMLVTGHKSVKQYMDYIKITSEQNAKILSKSDFFNMKLKRV